MDLIAEYKEMIAADTEHLMKYLKHGDVVLAHQTVDSIIKLQRAIEDAESNAQTK